MEQSLVSIVVPIYNVEKYLPECIDSIIDQTYKNIEIILVNDGSTDNCGKICDEYAPKDERIKVIHKENGGLSDARNCGIDIANGEYIAFIDSDDYVSEEYIEQLYNAIIENNTKISQCNLTKVTDTNEEIKKIGYNENARIKSGYDMIKDLYTGHWENIIACNKLYCKELFEKLRYPFGKIHEDEFTTYKILYDVDNVAIVQEYLYKYRQNENSITREKFKLKRLDLLTAYEERLKFFAQKAEKELYDLSLVAYLGKIVECYVKTQKYIEKSEEIQRELIEKYRKNYKKTLNFKKISNIKRVRLLIFYIVPSLYYKIIKRTL